MIVLEQNWLTADSDECQSRNEKDDSSTWEKLYVQGIIHVIHRQDILKTCYPNAVKDERSLMSVAYNWRPLEDIIKAGIKFYPSANDEKRYRWVYLELVRIIVNLGKTKETTSAFMLMQRKSDYPS